MTDIENISSVDEPPERSPEDKKHYELLKKGILKISKNYFQSIDRLLTGDSLQQVIDNPQRNGELKYFHSLEGERRREYLSRESKLWMEFTKSLGIDYVGLAEQEKGRLNLDFSRFFAFYSKQSDGSK